MTKLWDIPGFTQDLFEKMVQDGYVNIRNHPTLDLSIVNYTNRAQVSHDSDVWNVVTMNCRGIIFDHEANIVAKGYKKFWNHTQNGAGLNYDLDEPVQVTDKADGSLAILYPSGDRYAIATRGSFESDQAISATALLQARYPDFVPPAGYTMLFEYVGPDNRIVLQYDKEDLILLGGVCDFGALYGHLNDSKHTVGLFEAGGPELFPEWPGPVTKVFDYKTFGEVLASPPKDGTEGYVIRFTRTCEQIKSKNAKYVQLHRIVTGLNERSVWEHLMNNNGNYLYLLESVPDEFHDWLHEKARRLLYDHDKIVKNAKYLHSKTTDLINFSRKDYAEWAAKFPTVRPYLFMLLDGKFIDQAVWKSLKPVGQTEHLKQISEDVA